MLQAATPTPLATPPDTHRQAHHQAGPPAVVTYLAGLQRDARLLLRYLARKADRPLPSFVAGPNGAAPGDVLTADPATLPSRFAELATMLDDLSRRAAPATVSSIRLTSAYLRVPVEDDEPPSGVIAKVRRLHLTMLGVILIAIGATVLAVLLLAHVDDGRRAIQQLTAVRGELGATRSELEKLRPDEAWAAHRPAGAVPSAPAPTANGAEPARPAAATAFLNYCPPRFEAYQGQDQAIGDSLNAAIKARREAASWLEPATPRAAALCTALEEGLLREDLVFIRLAAWNCRTSIVMPGNWFSFGHVDGCGVPAVAWPNTVVRAWWERTELRAASSMSVLSGFVLPLLLGCVGGCAYALRRLDQKLSQWTLETRDGQHSLLRVLLATMLGGLLGVVWSGDAPVQLGGFTLSLAAAAFFVGFSLEVVFTVIEAMVDGVAGKLKAPPPAPVVAAPPPVIVAPPPPRPPVPPPQAGLAAPGV